MTDGFDGHTVKMGGKYSPRDLAVLYATFYQPARRRCPDLGRSGKGFTVNIAENFCFGIADHYIAIQYVQITDDFNDID
jgi:hypothetical protein